MILDNAKAHTPSYNAANESVRVSCLRKIGDAERIDDIRTVFIYVYVNIWEKSVVRLDKRTSMRRKIWGYLTSLEGYDIEKTQPRNIVFRIEGKAKKYSRYSIVKIG